MTEKESKLRQRLYVENGMLSAFIAGIAALDVTDWRQVAAFVAGIWLAGNNAMRAYVDGSVRDIQLPILPDGLPQVPPMP